MTKRELLSFLAVKTGVNDLFGYMQKFAEQRLTILAYHRVMDVDVNNYPFDLSLISATPEDFEWQLKHIKKRFTPIRFEDIINFIDQGTPLPNRPIIISFDDGFDDNYHTVFPIAKRLDVPFSVFLSTDYIGSDDTFWFEKLAYLFARSPFESIEVGSEIKYRLSESLEDRRRSYGELVEKIKYFPQAERSLLLMGLFSRYAEVFESMPSEHKMLSSPITWEHVKEMAEWGVEFGGHGASHNILTTMSESGLRSELAGSKQALEKELGHFIDLFSYPNGLAEDYCNATEAALHEEGYKTAVSYVPGSTEFKELDTERYKLKRIHVDNDVSRDVFSIMLNFPGRVI